MLRLVRWMPTCCSSCGRVRRNPFNSIKGSVVGNMLHAVVTADWHGPIADTRLMITKVSTPEEPVTYVGHEDPAGGITTGQWGISSSSGGQATVPGQ